MGDTEIARMMTDGRKSRFVDRTQPLEARMIRIVWRLLRNANDAEDAFQDAMMTVWRKLDRVEKHPRPDLLILRITVDTALNRYQKRSRERGRKRPLDSIAEIPHGDPTPREEMEREELRIRILEAIAELPRQESLAVFLRLIEEQSFSEIAAALDCQETTARSHHSKGLAKLRESLAPFLEMERSVVT